MNEYTLPAFILFCLNMCAAILCPGDEYYTAWLVIKKLGKTIKFYIFVTSTICLNTNNIIKVKLSIAHRTVYSQSQQAES